MIALPLGLIFRIASDAGITLRGTGDKRHSRCPFHDDRSPSAFVSADNVFYCSVCTPDGGLSAKAFCERLGLDWKCYVTSTARASEHRVAIRQEPTFTADHAVAVWNLAHARARDDEAIDADREVYDFLISRGLMEAFEYGTFGVLSPDMVLPEGVTSWPKRGYRLVAPLYDHAGNIVSLQSRSVRGGDPKTLAPKGGRLAGTVFADERGLAVLRGSSSANDTVILGEGLTDYLALSITSCIPVFCAPGTGNAVSAVGPWVKGRRVLIALDCDEAGQRALPDVAQRAHELGAVRVQQVEWPGHAKDACDVVSARGTCGLWEFLDRQVKA